MTDPLIFGDPFFFESSTVTIERDTTTDYNDEGEWIRIPAPLVEITVVTEPISRERDPQDSNARLTEERRFFVESEVDVIVTKPPPSGSSADVIIYKSERFRCEEVQDWGSYKEIIALRIEGQR